MTHEADIKDFFVALEDQPFAQTLNQLLVAERMFMSMIEGVIVTDIKGNIQFINPAYSKITGYGEEIIGANPRILQSGRHNKEFYRQMWKSIAQQGQWQGEIWNRRKNGELYIQSTTISRINDDDGKPIYYASVIMDITERKIAEQKFQDDLLLAKELQKGALSKPIKESNIHIEGIYTPSYHLGGDMYIWYKIDDDRYGIILIDVMGHGIASALVSMSVRALVRRIVMKHQEPDRVLQELNQHMYSFFRDEHTSYTKKYYLTCVYVLVNIKERVIKYASAGHPPSFLIDSNGRSEELNKGTVPLGLLPDIEVEIGTHDYDLNNTKIILYTDGVIENKAFSTSENINYLKEVMMCHAYLEGVELLQYAMNKILDRQRVSSFEDDVAMVCITIFGE